MSKPDGPPSATNTADPETLFMSILRGRTDPYPTYRQLLDTAPVLRTRTGDIVLSRFADCDTALRDRRLGKGNPETRPTSADPDCTRTEAWRRHNMLFLDPPQHTRIRRPLRAGFGVRDIDALRAQIVEAAQRLVDTLAAQGSGDFIEAVADPLPLVVIENLLGIPDSDRAEVTPLARDLAAVLRPFADDELLSRAFAAREKLVDYLRDLLAYKRTEPQDDLLSLLVAAEGDVRLTSEEVVASAILVFAAGFETTSCLLGNGVLALLANPGQHALLRARPELVSTAVEEILRYDPPAQLNRRVVLEPVDIAGHELSPGQFVVMMIAGANRDPARFTAPERFDVTRSEGGNLALAAGAHFCLGGQLAQIQAEAVFGALVWYDIESTGDMDHRPAGDLRGPTSLPITLTAP